MPTLSQDTVREFLARFYSFNDAVLRKLGIAYADNGERSVSVWIASRDANMTSSDGWVCVHLLISRVQDFCFAETAKTSAQVLSYGLHICWFDGLVGVDIGHFLDAPDDLEELKLSKFFASGFSVDWTVHPY